VSQILLEDYSITIQPGKKGECPQCRERHFSIKHDDAVGKCFHPPCGFVLTPSRDTGDYRSSLTRVLDAVYHDCHRELLALATCTTSPQNAYTYLHDERGIHPTVIADALLGAVPAGYDVTPHFQAAIAEAEQAVQKLGALKRGRPSRQLLHAEQRLQHLKDAQQKLVECLAHKAGWVVFFYADAAHQLVALRLRQPYSKHFVSFKPGIAGLFGCELFTPYRSQANYALNGFLVVVEGEVNYLQVQSLTIRYAEATGQPCNYINACAVGGVLGADVETIRRVATHPVVVYDNDANQAGFELVRRIQQVMPIEAATTPIPWGEKQSDLDSFIRDFDEDHRAAWKGVQALMAARQPYGRIYSGTGVEFFDVPITGGKQVFVPKLLATALMEQRYYRFIEPTLFVYDGGVYVPSQGEIRTDCNDLLGNAWDTKRRNEAIAYVQDVQRTSATPPDAVRYLNMTNGLYDLETGILGTHTPTYFSMVQLPYAFMPGATCPAILAWVKEATRGDDAIIQVLRAYLKAIVIGATSIQRILEVVGPGGSGKGTYIRLAQALVGLSNTKATELKHLETNRFELSTLRWKRLVVITDADRYGGPIPTLKALTGGDLLRMEAKFVQGHQDQTASGLVLISANEEVTSSDYTSGLGRRRLTVYFTHTPDTPRDLLSIHGQTFKGEFVQELPGLLNWVLAMDDATMYDTLSLAHQYQTPSLRTNWVQALLATNALAEWAHGHLVLDIHAITKVGSLHPIDITTTKHDRMADKSESVRETYYNNAASWLYPNYVQHMREVGNKPIALRRFTATLYDFLTQQLKAQGIDHRVDNQGSRFHGVRLRTAQDDARGVALLLDEASTTPF
jgi:phage/plasmid-associated DNA primase